MSEEMTQEEIEFNKSVFEVVKLVPKRFKDLYYIYGSDVIYFALAISLVRLGRASGISFEEQKKIFNICLESHEKHYKEKNNE